MARLIRSFLALSILALLSAALMAAQEAESYPSAADCTYLSKPGEFLRSTELHRMEVSQWTETVRNQLNIRPIRSAVDAAEGPARMPRKNFIDEYIFGRMERDGIKPAPLASDLEFLRRVTFDMTGRPPTPNEMFAFLDDPSPNKRDTVVD